MNVLPSNTEHYKSSFKKYRFMKEKLLVEYKCKVRLMFLCFIDSLKFMASSLDILVKNMPKEKMKITRCMFRNDLNKKQTSILLTKRCIPL